MLVEDILGRGLRTVHDLSHSLDNLGCVDRGKLLNELIVRNVIVIVVIKVSKKLVDLFVDEAYAESSQFMIELLFGETMVGIGVYNVKQNGKCHVIYDQVIFNFPSCL